MSDEKPARRTVVEGGDVGAQVRNLDARLTVLDGKVDTLHTKMDEVISAHRASPLKRTFDIAEKMASPMTGGLLLGNLLVVLIWLTGSAFEGAGYKIGTRASAANIDSDIGEDPPGTTGPEP